jgi:hypothetical protein
MKNLAINRFQYKASPLKELSKNKGKLQMKGCKSESNIEQFVSTVT